MVESSVSIMLRYVYLKRRGFSCKITFCGDHPKMDSEVILDVFFIAIPFPIAEGSRVLP